MRAQRNKKRKRIKKSVLDNVSGIGSVLKKRLMQEFKNINTIKKASVQELMTVRGINEKIAKVIFNELKS